MPSAVVISQCIAAHVRIAHAAISKKTGSRCQQPVGIEVQTCRLSFHDIAVGGVQQVVAVVEAVLLDAVVGERVVQGGIQHQLRCVEVIHQSEVMRLLHIEVVVTVGQCRWIGTIHIRIQVGDTRTGDAHVIGKT